MSLKAFHVFFIMVSILLSLGVGSWGVRDYRASESIGSLCLGVGSFVVAVVLFVYGRWFLRKLKNVSYI